MLPKLGDAGGKPYSCVTSNLYVATGGIFGKPVLYCGVLVVFEVQHLVSLYCTVL